jgi:hypothetical protein
MQPAAPAPSLLRSFLQAGGSYPFVLIPLALMLTLWGLINLAFVRNRFALAAQAVLSFAPLAYACVGLVGALTRFQALTTAPGPPHPEGVAETMLLAILLGLLGSTSTAVPAVIGICALARNLRAPASVIGKDVIGEI